TTHDTTDVRRGYGQDIDGQPRGEACKAGEALCGEARSSERDYSQADDQPGGARGGAGPTAGSAPRFEQDPSAQSLPNHGPPARLLSQVRPRPHQAARGDHAGRNPGPRKGQLVTAGTTGAR